MSTAYNLQSYNDAPDEVLTAGGKLAYGSQSTDPHGFETAIYTTGADPIFNHNVQTGVTPVHDIEVGLAVRYRTVDTPIAPDADSHRPVGNTIVSQYTAIDGPQSVANGSNSDNAARASANVDPFVSSHSDPLATLEAAGDTFHLSFQTTAPGSHGYLVNEDFTGLVNASGALTWTATGGQGGSVYSATISDDATGHIAGHGSINSNNVAAFEDPTHYFGPRTETTHIEVDNSHGVEIVGATAIVHFVDAIPHAA